MNKPTYAKSDDPWEETTVDELYKLIGLLIYFGLCKLPTMRLYWARSKFWSCDLVKGTMTRDRFSGLLAFLDLVDYDLKVPSDRLKKLRGFVSFILEKCQSLYQP